MVVRGGTERISTGSTTAAAGMKAGLLMVVFSAPLFITDTWVTSLPVPEVVGMATIFSRASGNGLPL